MRASPRELLRPVGRFFEHLHFSAVRRETLRFASTFYAGVTLVCAFALVALSGILLMYFYVPTVRDGYRSVRALEEHLRYGAPLRAFHYYAANLMVLALFLHMTSLVMRRAYLRRKWANWLVGILLFLLTVALSYTGYLLPYDQLGYWAIMVGSNMAGSAPVVGPLFKQLMLGGAIVSDVTLLRFYVHHCIGIPAVFCPLLSLHLYLIRRDKGLTLAGPDAEGSDHVPSRPALYHFELGVFAALTLLLSLASLLHHPRLGAAANAAVTPNPMKAPWYLVGLQELLHFHSPFVVSYLVPGTLLLLLALLPLLPDRLRETTLGGSTRGPRTALLSTLALVAFASVFLAFYVNVVLVTLCVLFAATFLLAQPGRRLHGRLGRTSLPSFLLLFPLSALAALTFIGQFLRGPNWELVLCALRR